MGTTVFGRLTGVFSIVLLATISIASPRAQAPARADAPPEAGIPVTDATVQKACSPCHNPDANGIMSRISFRRTTPEGWETTIRRMASLNGMQIEPAVAREVLRYLSNHHGLAPDEAEPAAFESERRMIDFKYTANADAEKTCIACHSMGRVMLQRRSKEDWHLLIDMHRGWYPLTDFQAFRRMGPPQREPGPDGRPPDNRHPVEKALEHLTAAYPLHTPEWAAWSASMRPPKLAGSWTISGHEVGKGPVYGTATIAAGAAPDEFTSTLTYVYARSGERVTRSGRAIVYAGHQWRGRSTRGGSPATNGGSDESALREVMAVARDWSSMRGRWFTGGYDEIGLDVTLRRTSGQPTVLGASRTALRTGAAGQEVRLYGTSLPATLSPRDIDFGPGITVTQVTAATPESVTVTVDVAKNAAVGPRDLALGGVVSPGLTAVFDTVHYLKVTPEWAMARVGGVTFPKGLARFEATAFHHGRDGRQGTKDDVALGVVDVKWSLEEYSAVLNDDDIKYVGSLNASTGEFTPNVEGPNPQRAGNANNIGDVWVVASYQPEGAKRPLRARAHLLVTVPLYMRWGTEAQSLR